MPARRTSAPGRRFDWDEMRRYWERHHELRAQTNLNQDAHALDNVCTPQAPAWLNRHFARGQQIIFDRLMAQVPARPGRALDVGCGGARWSERLSARGWDVTGIDLQAALIEHNRRRLPHIRFERVALQDLEPDQRFDLVCSVTVLGHIPHGEQPRALEKLRAISAPGGRVLALENVRDQSAHVFANSVAEWIRRFECEGFQCVAVAPYDYNPALRAVAGTRRIAARSFKRRAPVVAGPDSHMARVERARSVRAAAQRVYEPVLRLAGAADRRVDPWLTGRAAKRPAPVHAGMLFVRR